MPRRETSRSKSDPILPPLPRRESDANKGDCGKWLIVGGSRGMAGAACLAARAAGRSGAGLVKVAVPEPIWDLVATKLDEALTAGWPATRGGGFSERALDPLMEAAEWSDVVVLGPGVGTDPQTVAVVREAVRRIAKPLVLDADGLNAFAGRVDQLAQTQESQKDPTLVLTPHPGEMARLLRKTTKDVQSNREGAARTCAQSAKAVVLLKGAGTIVTDAQRLYVNRTGNPGMATGGSGDVLAGLLGALMGQGVSAYEATCLAAHLHGLAGDLAAKRLTEWSMVAGDLIDELPNAFYAYARGATV
jgi:ADP-dependent NAD(P)H-hydrate dehydratase / NAD(P)H-hydrate epimerase